MSREESLTKELLRKGIWVAETLRKKVGKEEKKNTPSERLQERENAM